MNTTAKTEVCSVCGDTSTPPTSTCPTYLLRSHTRCSGKKMGAQCNKSRSLAMARLTRTSPTSASATPVTKSTQQRVRLAQKKPSFPTKLQPLLHNTSSPRRVSPHQQTQRKASKPPVRRPPGTSTTRDSKLDSQLCDVIDETKQDSEKQQDSSVGRVTDSQALTPPISHLQTDASPSSRPLRTNVTVNSPEMQKSLTTDAPLGDVSLLGISNILIPVSTMELFFQRFDMLHAV